MNFQLTEEQKMMRDMARDFARNTIEPRVEEIESADKYPADLFAQMAEIGFISAFFPEEYGGMAMGNIEKVLVIEEISKVNPSTGVLLAVSCLPLEAFMMYGTEEQKQKYVVPALKGETCGSFAFTEPETGSDPKQLTTIATKQPDGTYRLNGTKRFISNAAYEGPVVIFAKEAETEQCTAFIIDKFCKGYSLSTPWEKVGFRGSHIYDVFLDDVVVEEKDVLGEHGNGFDILLNTTTLGKLDMTAVLTGAMGGSFELAVKYAKEKLHRGKPIAKFPTIQSRIAQIEANTLSARLMLYKAAEDADLFRSDMYKVRHGAALVKGYVADLATETCMMALNVLGAYGVTNEYKVERFVRDSLIGPNIEGAADIQRLIAGNYVLRH